MLLLVEVSVPILLGSATEYSCQSCCILGIAIKLNSWQRNMSKCDLCCVSQREKFSPLVYSLSFPAPPPKKRAWVRVRWSNLNKTSSMAIPYDTVGAPKERLGLVQQLEKSLLQILNIYIYTLHGYVNKTFWKKTCLSHYTFESVLQQKRKC